MHRRRFFPLFIVSLITVLVVAQPMAFLIQPAHADMGIGGESGQNNGPFTLTFTEIGLPNATVWSATVNGTTKYSIAGEGLAALAPAIAEATVNGTTKNSTGGEGGSSGSISFVLPKGTYSYRVGGVSGFSSSPSSGSISLTGNVDIPVRFTIINGSTFNVTFVEIGLPIGHAISSNGKPENISWSVSLGSTVLSSSKSNMITFSNVSAKQYSWHASMVNVTGEYYSPQPPSGNITVPDQLTVFVTYSGYAMVSIRPDNAFFGNVAPSGTHWYRVGSVVNVTAVAGFESTFFDWSFSSNEFPVNPNSNSTKFTVMGPGNVTANFATAVGFRESGLPQGGSGTSYTWGFEIIPKSSPGLTGYNSSQWFYGPYNYQAVNSSAIVLYLTNGSYDYVVSPAYVSNPSSTSYIYTPTVINRSLIADNTMLVFNIQFVPGVPVNFTETGLPNGTQWAIDINGTYHNFVAGYKSAPVYLPPGVPLTFSVQPITGYTISPESGTLTFSGPSSFTVNFAPVSPKGEVYSQYSGYFYSGIPIFNQFGFNGSWGSAMPVSVSGMAGPISLPFSYANGYWTSQSVNMGRFNSSFELEVQAAYPNGSLINYTYPVSVVSSPSWLVAFANSPDVSMSVSPPVQQWGNSYTVTFNYDLATATLMDVSADLNIMSGNYAFLPSVPVTMTLNSAGNMAISTSINPNSVSIKLDSISLTIGGSVSLSGSLGISQNTIVWNSASLELAFKTLVSTSVPVAGINVPGTDYTVGIWLKIGAGPDFSILVQLEPTTNGNYEIMNGLPVAVSQVTGGVGVSIAVSVNGGLTDIVSAGGGGSLTFMQYIGVPPEPLDEGGTVTGTVFISASAFGISWTIWSDSGLLYSWGSSSDPAVNHSGNLTYVKPYFNTTGYNSLVWVNGSWNGTLLHDVYPYTTFSTSHGKNGDYLFYTYYDPSTQMYPLSVRGIFISNDRNATILSMPPYGNFETTGPEAFALPNGSVELLYAALPESQVKNSSSLLSVNTVLLQAAMYNGTSWSKPVNVTTYGVANSYIYSDGNALVIETPSLFSTSTTVQEYNVHTGKLLASFPVANASYFEYFNPELSTAVIRFSNMSYAFLNLSTGKILKISSPLGQILQVGSAMNSSDLVYYLISSSGNDIFELYNVSSSKSVYMQNVSENAYPSYFVYNYPISALITGQEPSGISVYAVNLGNSQYRLYTSQQVQNMTFYKASEGNGKLYIYSADSYGPLYQPLYNLSSLIVPFGAPPNPSITLNYNGTGVLVYWSVPYAMQYNISRVYLAVNGGQLTSGKFAVGSYFYPVSSQGNYLFSVTAQNAVGNSTSSSSIGIYPINFAETGLPANSTWSVSIRGISTNLSYESKPSSGPISFLLPNGKYSYTIMFPSGYTASQRNGSVQVNGSATSLSITFSKPANYTLWIIASVVIIVLLAVAIFVRKVKGD